MKYQVYQITVTAADVRDLNAGVELPKLEARTEMRFADNMSSAAAAAMDAGHYTHVADIEADDLDAVFEIGNIGPEENIVRHRPMSSISVCDVIATDETSYVVAPIGFKELARGEG